MSERINFSNTNNGEGEFNYSREAAKITLDKVSSWEELNAVTEEEGRDKFSEKTKELWNDFAVHGIMAYDRESGQRVLRPFTDLDGKSAIEILKMAGINTENLKYIKPGESIEGSINIDTGDQFGVVYNSETYTAYFDHHGKGKDVTSATEIMYKTMIDLDMIEKSKEMDRVIDFVTKIDNAKYPPEEFLKSGKTILGLQRSIEFNQLVEYFKDHDEPTKELEIEELEKYGLRDASEKQQKIVDESMEKLEKMKKEEKVIETSYGKIVININNELAVGASAAYVEHDGIINYTPEKSFAVTLKEKTFNAEDLQEKLGDGFQGKIIRGNIWIYNEKEPLNLKLEDIVETLKK